VLGDSLLEHNPDVHFVIGLVDRLPSGMDLDQWRPFELFPVEKLPLPQFAEMEQKYDVVELNTAVKPYYMEYLYSRDPKVEAVIYLDPDIVVFGSFKPLLEKLRNFNIIVTPHDCTYDNSALNIYYETAMLGTGIYNLGFIATARRETTFAFLKWWQKRLLDYCYYRGAMGVFVDQLWVTLAPLYFEGVYVEKDLGYNMCYWNHFERRLERANGRYVVNGRHDLFFYHFSSYDPLKPDVIANRTFQPIMTFSERPDLRPLYDFYGEKILAAGYSSFKSIPCAFGRKPKPVPKPKLTPKLAIQIGMKKILRAMPPLLRTPLRRLTRFVADNS
jgi:hypothetical protein